MGVGRAATVLLGVGLDELFNSNGAGSNETFLRDALNSTVAVTSSSESVLDQPIYDPYGNTSDSEAFGFTGRENDGNGGFYFMRARYYDAAIARFISRDPSGPPKRKGGLAVSAFALADKLHRSDAGWRPYDACSNGCERGRDDSHHASQSIRAKGHEAWRDPVVLATGLGQLS